MSNDTKTNPDFSQEDPILEIRRKYFPKSEECYLYGDSPPENDKFKHMREVHLNFEEPIEGSEEVNTKNHLLTHIGWSVTIDDLLETCIEDDGDNIPEIPITCSNFNDNSEITGIKTGINEFGACHLSLEYYCRFFELFKPHDPKVQDLLDKCYNDPDRFGYKFEESDWNIPCIKQFIDEIKKDRNQYERSQLTQSLLQVSNYLNCQFLVDMFTSMLALDIDTVITDIISKVSSDPEAFKKTLKQGENFNDWTKDNDDLIVEGLRQKFGIENNWTNYEEYSNFKSQINWIKDERDDPRWNEIEKEAQDAFEKYKEEKEKENKKE